jgi:tryptophan synthase alpha chain
MNPIDSLFQRLRLQGRKAFIPFLTAGDPNLAAPTHLASILARYGDLLEIGFPYSDPIADGPVIQASYTRALDGGVHRQAGIQLFLVEVPREPLLTDIELSATSCCPRGLRRVNGAVTAETQALRRRCLCQVDFTQLVRKQHPRLVSAYTQG